MRSLINKILKESEEEFDWVHVNDMEEPKGMTLYNIIKKFFEEENVNYSIETRHDGEVIYLKYKNLGSQITGNVMESYWTSNFTIDNILEQLSADIEDLVYDADQRYYRIFFKLEKLLKELFSSLRNNNINESEEDFGWADDILDINIDKPKQVWVNNKRYALISEETGNGWSSNGFRTTNWSGWYDVSDITQHNGEVCYVVNFSDTYPRVYMPIRDFRTAHVRY